MGLKVLDRSEGQPHVDMWAKICHLKASHSKEHTSLHAPFHTGERPRPRIVIHISFPAPNYMSHNLETVMTNAGLYKGEPSSPSRYT